MYYVCVYVCIMYVCTYVLCVCMCVYVCDFYVCNLCVIYCVFMYVCTYEHMYYVFWVGSNISEEIFAFICSFHPKNICSR
jgi:hypothetical protein